MVAYAADTFNSGSSAAWYPLGYIGAVHSACVRPRVTACVLVQSATVFDGRNAMTYRQRMTGAGVCSMAAHVLLITMIGMRMGDPGGGPDLRPEPIVLILEPAPQPALRLVDVHTPATEPVNKTDLIAEVNSKAADQFLQDGDELGPQPQEITDFDVPAVPAMPPVMEPAIPEPAPQPERRSAPERAPELRPDAPVHLEAPPVAELRTEVREPEAASRDADERIKLARAAPRVPPVEAPRTSSGRPRNAVEQEGFTNFEALQDEIAPYLQHVRKQVGREWNEALVTRYLGTSPTKATIDCAIAPNGVLVSVSIVGAPDDPVYAALCRRAIQKAAPFEPFPFTVPDVYRNRNLEIRWTFSFLK